MRVALLHGPGDVRLERRVRPTPGPGEVLLDVEVALTGGTVLKTVRRGGHARLGRPPLALGHEGVGRIAALGAGVTGFTLGERVVPGPSGPCGRCTACARGREELCDALVWFSGLFADAALLPAAIVARSLHRVPPGLSSERAALADNVACVLKGHEVTPGRSGERTLVIGSGPLGLLWTRVLSNAGARVVQVGRQAEAARRGLAFGAEQAWSAAELESHGPDARADLVIEAVGTPASWHLALQSVAPGGRVSFFGGAPEGTTLGIDAHRLHYEELLLTASFHHAPRHMAAALTWLETGLVSGTDDLGERLLGERVELERLPRWIQSAIEGPTPKKARVEP